MANSILISLGERYKFRLGKNSVFGAYRNQYVAILSRGQQGYSVVFRIKPEAESILKTVMTRDHLRKITSKRLINLHFSKETLNILGVGENILSSRKTVDNFQKYIDLIIDEIERHQIYPGATTEKTVLIEEVAGPNTDTLVSEAQEKLNKEANKLIDKDKGILFGIPLSILSGIVLGLLSALANVYSDQDLNPFGKGLVAISLCAGIFRYLAGGLDKSSRIIVGIMGVICFLSWDFSRIFFFWYLKSDKQMSFEELINIYKHSLMNFDNLGKYAIVAIVSTVVGIFLLKRTDRSTLDLQVGEILDGDYLKWAKDTIRGQKYLGLVFAGLFFFSLIFIFLFSSHEYKNWDYISYGPFFLMFFISSIAFTFLTYFLISKKIPILLLGMKSFHQGLTQKAGVLFFTSILAALPALAICFFISYLNMTSDGSDPVSMTAKASQKLFYDDKECLEVDFQDADGKVFSNKVCKIDAPYIPLGVQANFEYHKGNLRIPFITDFRLPVFRSFKAYLEAYPDQYQLRYLFVSHFLNQEKSDWLTATKLDWKRNCELEAAYGCRLTAYVHEFEKKPSEALEYYSKGCFGGKDPYACRGFNNHKNISPERKKSGLKEIEKFCDSGNLNYCAELGWSMMEMNLMNKEKLIRLFEKPCAAGNEDACLSLNGLKEKE